MMDLKDGQPKIKRGINPINFYTFAEGLISVHNGYKLEPTSEHKSLRNILSALNNKFGTFKIEYRNSLYETLIIHSTH